MQAVPDTSHSFKAQPFQNRSSTSKTRSKYTLQNTKTSLQKKPATTGKDGMSLGDTNRKLDDLILNKDAQFEKHRKLMLENKLLQKKREERAKLEKEQRQRVDQMIEAEKKRRLRQIHAMNLRRNSNLLSDQDKEIMTSPKNVGTMGTMTRNQSQPPEKRIIAEDIVWKEKSVVHSSLGVKKGETEVSSSINEFEKALKKYKKGKYRPGSMDSSGEESVEEKIEGKVEGEEPKPNQSQEEIKEDIKGSRSLSPDIFGKKTNKSSKFQKGMRASDQSQTIDQWNGQKPLQNKQTKLKDESIDGFSFISKDEHHSYHGAEEPEPSFLQGDSIADINTGGLKSNRGKGQKKPKKFSDGSIPIGSSPGSLIAPLKNPNELNLRPNASREGPPTSKSGRRYQQTIGRSQEGLENQAGYENEDFAYQSPTQIPLNEEGFREISKQEKEIQQFIVKLNNEKRKDLSRVEHKYDPEQSNLSNMHLNLAEKHSNKLPLIHCFINSYYHQAWEHTTIQKTENTINRTVLPNIKAKDATKTGGTSSYAALHSKKVNYSEGRSSYHHTTKDSVDVVRKLLDSTLGTSPKMTATNTLRTTSQQTNVSASGETKYPKKSEFQAKFHSHFQTGVSGPAINTDKSAVVHEVKSHPISEVKLPQINQTQAQEIKVKHYSVPLDDSVNMSHEGGSQKGPIRLKKDSQSKAQSNAQPSNQNNSGLDNPNNSNAAINKSKYHAEPIQQPTEPASYMHGEVSNKGTEKEQIIDKKFLVPKNHAVNIAKAGPKLSKNFNPVNKHGKLGNQVFEIIEEEDRLEEKDSYLYHHNPKKENKIPDEIEEGVIKIHTNANLRHLLGE